MHSALQMKMTLKFRRRPHDAFPMRSITSRKTRNAFDMSSHRISAVSSAFGSFYEHFVPLQPDESMIDLLRNKSFTLKELQGLKGQLTDAEIELEPILEVENILDDDLNDYYEYEDVEEEERKEDENGDTEIENKIESDLINESDLITSEKDTCKGYTLVKKNNGTLQAESFIKCNHYETKNYQSWRMGENNE